MSCVSYLTWTSAKASCDAAKGSVSVKGFGYSATGLAGLRGLRGLGVTPPSPPTGQSVISPPSGVVNINIVADPLDPCTISAQTPCSFTTGCPATCPTGYASSPSPTVAGQCVCTLIPVGVSTWNAPAPLVPVVAAPAATAGFAHWGLLAALGVGAAGLFLVMHKKKPA